MVGYIVVAVAVTFAFCPSVRENLELQKNGGREI